MPTPDATTTLAGWQIEAREPEPLFHHMEEANHDLKEGVQEGLHIGEQYDLPGQGGAPASVGPPTSIAER